MAGGSYGTVMKAGKAAVASSGMDRHGPSNKNVKATRKSKPSPVGAIMSKTGPIKGRDKGTG
jgi:hypothetical protein